MVDAKLFGIHSSILKEAGGAFRLFRTVFKCKALGKIKLSEDHEEYAWLNKKQMERLNFIEGFHPNDIISVRTNM